MNINVPRKIITNVKIMIKTLLPTLCHQTFSAKITGSIVIHLNVMHAKWRLASQYHLKQKTSSHLQDNKRTRRQKPLTMPAEPTLVPLTAHGGLVSHGRAQTFKLRCVMMLRQIRTSKPIGHLLLQRPRQLILKPYNKVYYL